MKTLYAPLWLILITLCVAVSAANAQDGFKNPGFEAPSILSGAQVGTSPDEWFVFATDDTRQCGISDRKKRGGLQSVFFKAHKKLEYVSGLAQTFQVIAGKRYEFSVYAINDASDPIVGNAFGQVSIEWKDATGAELDRTYGPTWTFELSPIRWEKFMVAATAPAEATIANAVVTFFSKDAQGQGTCYIDDVKLAHMEPRVD